MFINDVGQNTWEEINEGLARRELRLARRPKGRPTDPRFVSPALRVPAQRGHPHGVRHHRRRLLQPADAAVSECLHRRLLLRRLLRRLDLSHRRERVDATLVTPAFATGIASPVDLQVAEDGSLYYLARGSGSATGVVSRVRYTGNPGALHHTAPGQHHRLVGAACHLQRGRVGHVATQLPVAAQQRQHRRRDFPELHAEQRAAERQRQPASAAASRTASAR